jgi:hypothetical protein
MTILDRDTRQGAAAGESNEVDSATINILLLLRQ